MKEHVIREVVGECVEAFREAWPYIECDPIAEERGITEQYRAALDALTSLGDQVEIVKAVASPSRNCAAHASHLAAEMCPACLFEEVCRLKAEMKCATCGARLSCPNHPF